MRAMRFVLRQCLAWWAKWTRSTAPITARAKLGGVGEKLAAQHLQTQGFRIVMRNWRHGRDEIDIVARDGVNLVFVEVKTRTIGERMSDTAGLGYNAIDARKRRALRRACRAYLAAMRERPRHFRFDVVEVKMHKNGTNELQHHQGVALFPKYF